MTSTSTHTVRVKIVPDIEGLKERLEAVAAAWRIAHIPLAAAIHAEQPSINALNQTLGDALDGVCGPADTAAVRAVQADFAQFDNAEHTPRTDATECRFKRYLRAEIAANATLYERLAKAGARNISVQAEINRLRQVQARQINRLHDTIADLEDKLLAVTTERNEASEERKVAWDSHGEVVTQNDALRAALTEVEDTIGSLYAPTEPAPELDVTPDAPTRQGFQFEWCGCAVCAHGRRP